MSVRKRQERPDQVQLLASQAQAQQAGHDDDKHEASDLRGDWGNIAILFFLYLLQGIPIGLAAAIPMLLQNRGASYKQQVSVICAFITRLVNIPNIQMFKICV